MFKIQKLSLQKWHIKSAPFAISYLDQLGKTYCQTIRHRTDSTDAKRDLQLKKGPHHGVHKTHCVEQQGETFPSPRHKIQAYQDDQRSEKVL